MIPFALMTRPPGMTSIRGAAVRMLTSHMTDRPALFVTDKLTDWFKPESLEHKGLLVRRTLEGAWDGDIDALGGFKIAGGRIGGHEALRSTIVNSDDNLSARLLESVDELLEMAELPQSLSEQIRDDARSIGCTCGSMCPSARELELNLEIVGEKTCTRWHQDQFVGRAIVSYTGVEGTEYAHDSNVDLWQLKNGGTNDRIIRDADEIESVGVGDILFIKGSRFPHGEAGLVHRSPKKRYHEGGRVLNRLVLKVDVV